MCGRLYDGAVMLGCTTKMLPGADFPAGEELELPDRCGVEIEVVGQRDLRFTTDEAVLEHLDVSSDKTEKAQVELRGKGIGT